MWAYAFIRSRHNQPVVAPLYADAGLGILDTEGATKVITYWDDPFVKCIGPETTIALPLPDVAVSSNADDLYPPDRIPEEEGGKHAWHRREAELHHALDAGTQVLAAVCLGSTGRSWFDERAEHYWQVRYRNLTWRGKRLVNRLERLYGRTADIVTYLDT